MTVASFLFDFISLLVTAYGASILLLYVFSVFWNGTIVRLVKLMTFAVGGTSIPKR